MDIIKNQISSIIGAENIISDPEGLQPYSKGNISFVPDRPPLFAVRPGSVEEVKSILRVAKSNKMPITPFSSAKNGHGSSIPTVPGVTIDLRRLNTIHQIDEPSRVAVVGPGVSFEQLQKAVNEKGLKVSVPVELPADSSVLSSYLEMTPLYAWPRYGLEFLLTMDILLASGETVQTGGTILPVFNERVYLPIFTIPSIMDKVCFGAQGTYGIATKGAVKLKTLHDVNEVIFMPFNSFAESLPVIKKIKDMEYGVEFFAANSTYLAGLLAEDNDRFEALKGDLPAVTAVLVLRGEQGRVDYQKEDLRDLAKAMNFKITDSLPGEENAAQILLDEFDFPKGYERAMGIKGAYNVIPFICTAMQVPMFDMVSTQMAGAFQYDKKNIGEMLLPAESTRFHFQYSFYSNPEVMPEHMVVKKFYEVLSGMLIKMGAFFSRPYGDWASLIYSKANQYKGLIKEYKEVLDPDYIMNPGKLDF